MLKKVLVGLAALLALLLVVISLQPATFHLERSIEMAVPPEAAFAQVNDFHVWRAWSPWEKLDPNMRRTYAGAAAGSGAEYAWASATQAGEGRMTIEHADPSRIVIRLEFLKPFPATNTVTFTFVPTPNGSKTTWAMDGTNNFVSKAFHLVFDMDKLVGADFERGLSAMKKAAEASAQVPAVAAKGP